MGKFIGLYMHNVRQAGRALGVQEGAGYWLAALSRSAGSLCPLALSSSCSPPNNTRAGCACRVLVALADDYVLRAGC
eukprot:1158514-Pelagomonas_calceolata.AAC.5